MFSQVYTDYWRGEDFCNISRLLLKDQIRICDSVVTLFDVKKAPLSFCNSKRPSLRDWKLDLRGPNYFQWNGLV